MGVASVGQKNEGGQSVQTSAIKISKFQSMVTTDKNTIVYLKVTKRVNLKSSHHVQKYVR